MQRTTITAPQLYHFTAVVYFDAETQLFYGNIPALEPAQSTGATLEELRDNLREAAQLVIEVRRAKGEEIDTEQFVGLQQIDLEL